MMTETLDGQISPAARAVHSAHHHFAGGSYVHSPRLRPTSSRALPPGISGPLAMTRPRTQPEAGAPGEAWTIPASRPGPGTAAKKSPKPGA
ncbi:hypothetical protein VTN00DRAFT_1668 [Thermoascus crustaceus]|uniref:uncharacterized protein n=1 Tax=Thermoascus crustaceus TaxID=5088 RepID=UPI0037430197